MRLFLLISLLLSLIFLKNNLLSIIYARFFGSYFFYIIAHYASFMSFSFHYYHFSFYFFTFIFFNFLLLNTFAFLFISIIFYDIASIPFTTFSLLCSLIVLIFALVFPFSVFISLSLFSSSFGLSCSSSYIGFLKKIKKYKIKPSQAYPLNDFLL